MTPIEIILLTLGEIVVVGIIVFWIARHFIRNHMQVIPEEMMECDNEEEVINYRKTVAQEYITHACLWLGVTAIDENNFTVYSSGYNTTITCLIKENITLQTEFNWHKKIITVVLGMEDLQSYYTFNKTQSFDMVNNMVDFGAISKFVIECKAEIETAEECGFNEMIDEAACLLQSTDEFNKVPKDVKIQEAFVGISQLKQLLTTDNKDNNIEKHQLTSAYFRLLNLLLEEYPEQYNEFIMQQEFDDEEELK